MDIGRKLYYEKTTGNILVDTGERSGEVLQQSTDEENFLLFRELKDKNPDNIGVLQLEFGQFKDDFLRCNGYRVNVTTNELVFSYPEPSEPEAPPVYQKPLTQQVKELKDELAVTQEAVDFLLMGGM